ncbi:hypothetical protein BN997_00532 [Oceanobacillus oncorhynchi]|uniref:Uncharacterized protein n=1 Tax=Oceanobacillus oncorhynchi TaxID=545501 RepID=A0A0A1MCD9_9BACI|nr:hypothetical protein [Oceanobacillus oncorhynchi]CEI80723.1 hypothetical protein BN997_00532 [Oceanobacillus oncorhynchi]
MKDTENLLNLELSRKLRLVELETDIVTIACNLMSDRLYTKEDAVAELIRIIHLLGNEQQAIMSRIYRLKEMD